MPLTWPQNSANMAFLYRLHFTSPPKPMLIPGSCDPKSSPNLHPVLFPAPKRRAGPVLSCRNLKLRFGPEASLGTGSQRESQERQEGERPLLRPRAPPTQPAACLPS